MLIDSKFNYRCCQLYSRAGFESGGNGALSIIIGSLCSSDLINQTTWQGRRKDVFIIHLQQIARKLRIY